MKQADKEAAAAQRLSATDVSPTIAYIERAKEAAAAATLSAADVTSPMNYADRARARAAKVGPPAPASPKEESGRSSEVVGASSGLRSARGQLWQRPWRTG
ncbi:MAG: hypothetical protein VXW49_19155, partial [Pseudomonadota bacterium]|nr:hypothetical protein [Pseudomonadota bacterium]